MPIDYQRHPLSAEYPDIQGQTWEMFLEGLKKNGIMKRQIVLLQGKILDGWQLYRACRQAEVKLTPKNFIEFADLGLPKDTTPEDYVEVVNDCRRNNEPMNVMMARAEKRRRRVMEARAKGATFQEIADREGVSKTQAILDAKALGQGVQKLCDRCQRVGKVKGCMMCRERNGNVPKKKKVDTYAPSGEVDCHGVPVPKRCKAALFDPWIQETIDFLGVLSVQFWKQRMADGIDKRKKYYPFFEVKDFVDGCAMAGNTIDELLEHLKTFRPAACCPACTGMGCPSCRMTGLVHRELYKELKK